MLQVFSTLHVVTATFGLDAWILQTRSNSRNNHYVHGSRSECKMVL